MSKQNYEWSEWFKRPEDEVTEPKVLKGLSGEDWEFKTPIGGEGPFEGYDANNFDARGGPYRITHYRYKIFEETSEQQPSEEAMRFNQGKPELSYVMDIMPALTDLVKRMEHGSRKYERNNWKKGFDKDALIDSALRHLNDFHQGKDIDLESGEDKLSNIGGVLFNVVMLTYFYGTESEYWKEKYA